MAAADFFNTVQEVYVAYYGRPADPVGLQFWADRLDKARGNLSEIIQSFGTSDEAKALFGTGTTQNKVNNIYRQLFSRDADAEGLTFYTLKVNQGDFTLVDVARRVLDGAQGGDVNIIKNKVASAVLFTAAVDTSDEILKYSGDSAAASARQFLSAVTNSVATRAQAESAVANAAAANDGSGTPGSNFILTASADSPLLSTDSDVIEARTDKHLQVADTINGREGGDTLLFSGNADTDGSFRAPNVSDDQFESVRSVEIVRAAHEVSGGSIALASLAAAAGVRTLTLQGGAKSVNLTGFNAALATRGTNNADAVTVRLSDAGTKTFNMASGLDVMNVTVANGAAPGSVQVRFTSSAVGDDTVNNATIENGDNDIGVDDEGTRLVASVTNAFNVVGLAADGTPDTLNQNRGNFTTVILGTAGADGFTTLGNAASVYINAGGGDDQLEAVAASDERHFLVGGTGNDGMTISTAAGGTVLVIAGDGLDLVNVGVDATSNSAAAVHNGVVSVNLGAGNDFVRFGTGLTVNTSTPAGNDTLTGGDGSDILAATSAQFVTNSAAAPTAANRTVKEFEVLQVTDAASGLITTANIQADITTVNLAAGTVAPPPAPAPAPTAATIAFESGDRTVNVGGPQDTSTGQAAGAVLGSNLTVTAAGTAATDKLTINNRNLAPGAVDTFAGKSIFATGFENVAVNTGSQKTVTQTIGVQTVRGDIVSSPTPAQASMDALSLTLSGVNSLTISSVLGNTNGRLTIDASGLSSGAALTLGAASVNGQGQPSTLIANDGAAPGTVLITGSAGNDVLTSGAASDTIDGGAGNDVLSGAGGNDSLAGGAGDDTLTGGAGTDSLQGGDGNDTFLYATVGDFIANNAVTDTGAGGAGENTIQINGAITIANTVSLARINEVQKLIQNATAAGSIVLDSDAELSGLRTFDLSASTGNSTLTFSGVSSALALRLTTGAGADTITGGAGNDLVVGGDGNDLIITSEGLDEIFGELGIDTVDYSAARLANGNALTATSTGITLELLAGGGAVSGGGGGASVGGLPTVSQGDTNVGADTVLGVENITGTAGKDMLSGDNVANVLNGGGGDDTIQGLAGGDQLIGGSGADQLDGGSGADVYILAASGDSATATVAESGMPELATMTESAGDIVTGDISDMFDIVAGGGAYSAVTAVTVLVDGAIETTRATVALDVFVYRDGAKYYLAYETAAGTVGNFGAIETVELIGIVDGNDTFTVSAAGVVTFQAVANMA